MAANVPESGPSKAGSMGLDVHGVGNYIRPPTACVSHKTRTPRKKIK